MPNERYNLNMKSVSKIKIQLAAIIALIAILLLVSGYFYYQKKKINHEFENYKELHTIGLLKTDQLLFWLNERKTEVSFFSSHLPYFQYISDVVSRNSENAKVFERLNARIIADSGYENIFILNKKLEFLYSYDTGFTYLDTLTQQNVLQVFETGELAIQDFYYCEAHKKLHFELFAPVKDNGQNIIAVVIFRIDPDDFLFPHFSASPISSWSTESYLVKQQGDSVRYLTTLLHTDNSRLQVSVSMENTGVTAVKAVLGTVGMLKGMDYRDEKVFSDAMKVPGTDWYIITEVDQKELYSGFNRQFAWLFGVIALLILLLVSLVSWIYTRRQSGHLKELLEKRSQLFQAQEEYGATLYSIGDGVMTTDRDGKVKNLNPVAEGLTGWKESEARGRPVEEVFNIINEETRASVESPVQRVLHDGRVVGLANQTLLISRNGRETPISDSGSPIRDRDGKLLGVIIVFYDQTKERLHQKLIEIRLRLFEFSIHHTLNEILTQVLDEIGLLLKSPVGCVHLITPGVKKVWMQAWSSHTKSDFCKAGSPGLLLDLDNGDIWADAVLQKKPVIHNDSHSFADKNGMPDGYAEVKRKLVVPVLRGDQVVALMGIMNKPEDYNEKDVEILSFLADISYEIAIQKLKESLLRQSEERFVHLYERAPLGYQSLDENGNFIEINQAWTETLGYSMEEVVGKWFGDFIDQNEVDAFTERFEKFKQNGKIHTEVLMAHKNGSSRLIAFEGKIGYRDDGSVEKTHCILRDITESRLLEEKLKEKERQLSSMVSNLPGFIYRCLDDDNWTMIYISGQCKEITGYEPDDLIHNRIRSFKDIIKQEYHKELRLKEGKVSGNKAFFRHEYEIVTATGETKWVYERGVGVHDKAGRLLFLEGYIEDITERKIAEIQLVESEEKFRLIMDRSVDAILLTQPDGIVLSANKAACKLFGMTEEEIRKAGRAGIVDPDDARVGQLLSQRDKSGFTEGEMNFVRRNGTKLTAEITSSLFKNSKGEIFTSMIIRDISERKKWEEDLLIAKERAEESDRLKSSFLANMSHEIRTPMNGILGFLDVLSTEELDDQSRHEYMEVVNISGQRLLDTINDIIEISKIEAGEQELRKSVVDITETIKYHVNFFKLQAKQKGVELFCTERYSSPKMLVETDKNKLGSILTNLIKNAIKFTAEGTIELGYHVENESLVFFVKDTGCGIPADKFESVFERFVQADMSMSRPYEGSGLGLTIAKAHVNMLGGKIWLESEIGKGSTFYFSIPYKSDHEETIRAVEQIKSPHEYPGEITILIAEDDDTSYRYLEVILKKRNVTLIRVLNGSEAIRVFKENPDISAILMDIKMAGMDGIEATREIRKFDKKVPIIAQSAYVFSDDEEMARQAGCSDYIAKPIKSTELFSILNKYLIH